MRNVPARPHRILTALGATAGLHYAWEMAQGPLFTNFASQDLLDHALPCLLAAVGDLVLASIAFTVTAAMFRSWRWPTLPRWPVGATVWVAFGLLATVLIERLALRVGQWQYTTDMPTVLGVGISPLLQWTVIPIILVPILRWACSDVN
jgi:hypothetical protein